MTNQTAYLTDPCNFEIRDSQIPVSEPDDIVVAVEHVGICGSDMLFYNDPTVGGELTVDLPIVLGHECAGTVVEVGSSVHHIKTGDRVALEPGVPCGKCEFCREGRYNLCPDVIMMAAPPFVTGSLSRYVKHPAAYSFKLPENVSTLEGALIEPLAIGLHAAERANAKLGQSALILGAGCIGLMTLLACKARGVGNIIVADLFDNRLKMAEELGATATINSSEADLVEEVIKLTDSQKTDLVFETAGSPHTAKLIPHLVKRGGSVTMVGNVHGDVPFDFNTFNPQEITMTTVFRSVNDFPRAIEGVSQGYIPVSKMVSDRFDFADVNKAFDYACNHKQEVLKVVIDL